MESGTNTDETLKQFRARVKDVVKPHHNDQYLARWLRARGYNLDMAEDMFRKNLEWRKTWNMDTILEDYQPNEVLTTYFPGGQCGYDKEGSPIWIAPAGNLDIKGLTMACKRQEIIRYNMYHMEKVNRDFREQTEKTGRPVNGGIFIADGKGLTMKKFLVKGMDVLLKMLAIAEANFPENLKRCYIINAPPFWGLIYNVCKPFLSDDTKRKVVVLGADWKEKLLEDIDANQLPKYWGGTMVDPDGNPKCPSKVCMGGEVPKHYYRSIDQCVDTSRLREITVEAGSKRDLDIEVTEANSVMRWVYQTEDCDIGFSVSMRKAGNSRNVEVVPYKRMKCHITFEDGTHECPDVGTYTIHFDNTYSWMTAKKITYLIDVIKPSDQIKRAEEVKQHNLNDASDI